MEKDIALSLDDAAVVLNKMHGDIEVSARKTLESVYEIAGKLQEVKESLPHGEFGAWVEKNLFFSLRTAQNYMNTLRRREQISAAGAEQLSQAYAAIKPPKVVKELEEIDVTVDPDAEAPTDFDYWPFLEQVAAVMKGAYDILSAQRTQNTPTSLYNMIGNLYEMYCRIDMWNPTALEDCDECEGKGFLLTQKDGQAVEVKCPVCIKGQCGPYKESEY